MALVDVERLSHIGLKTRNVESQTKFYEEMVGLKETARDDEGRVYLRCNERHHSLVLVPSEEAGDVDHLALQVSGGRPGVEAAADALAGIGIGYEEVEDVPGQGPTLRMRDSDGFWVELIGGMETVDPYYGPRAVQPRQQDHINLKVCDAVESAEFYEEVFGFKVSDRLSDAGIVWTRCNPYHHSLAFTRDENKTALHHLAFEVVDFAELGHQAEHLMRNGRQLLWGPGRHGPGNNQFEYFRDLDRNIIEFTCDARQIYDADQEVKVWNVEELWADLWGSFPPTEWLEHPMPEERSASVGVGATRLERA